MTQEDMFAKLNAHYERQMDEAFGFTDDKSVPEEKPWEIEDMDSAAWASRKAAAAARAKTDVLAWKAREIARIEETAQSEISRIERDLGFFTGHLGSFLSRLVNAGRKQKSLDLPGGRVAIRAKQPKVEILDEDAIAWAEANDIPVVRVKKEVDRVALKKRLDLLEGGVVFDRETGEMLPFIRWEPQGESVSFDPAE
jgi:phage host-nuclease inhibitor protein Gam